MTLLYIIYALLAIGVIIFIHEAGHFLAAKKVGVRVERFAVGFDPPIRGKNLRLFSFTRGETEYVIGMIPFGGYVKMAGETLLSDDREGNPDELSSKSVSARALVFAAGAIMNILSAFIFFMIAFALGVSFTAAEVGSVQPGSPAWESGFLPGDRIVEIDGSRVIEHMEMQVKIATTNVDEELSVKVERGREDSPETATLPLRPRWNPALGMNTAGFLPPFDDKLEPVKGGIAAQAGLRDGDRLKSLSIAGTEFRDLPVATRFDVFTRLQLANRPFEIEVERDGELQRITIPSRPQKTDSDEPQLGIHPGHSVIRAIRPGSEAAQSGLFLPGDQIVGLDGNPQRIFDWFTLAALKQAGKVETTLEVARLDGTVTSLTVQVHALIEWLLGDDFHLDRFPLAVPELSDGSQLSDAGLESADAISAINGQPVYSATDLADQIGRENVDSFALLILRGSEPQQLELSRPQAKLLTEIAVETFPPIAAVAVGSAAESVGLRAGDVIVRLGDVTLERWRQLIEVVQSHKPGDQLDVVWRRPDGSTESTQLTVGHRTDVVGVAWMSKEKLIKTGVLEAFTLGARRVYVVSKWVFLTLRSLIRRDVSAKNLTGPVGITHVLTKITEQRDFGFLLYFIALISVNLGLFNLLPFPILDGGHLLFLLIEKIKGSPVDIRVQEWATNIAFLLILALAIFVTFNDVARLLQ